MTFDSHTGPESDLADVTFRPLAMASATADLIVFGMLSSLFGPLLVTFAQRFHISLPDAGVVLSVYFVGAFCGVPLGWYSIRHLSGNVVLTITLLTMAVGACGRPFHRTGTDSWRPSSSWVSVSGALTSRSSPCSFEHAWKGGLAVSVCPTPVTDWGP